MFLSIRSKLFEQIDQFIFAFGTGCRNASFFNLGNGDSIVKFFFNNRPYFGRNL